MRHTQPRGLWSLPLRPGRPLFRSAVSWRSARPTGRPDHVATLAERGREFLENKNDLAAKCARLIFRFDQNGRGLAGISPAIEIISGNNMRMSKAKSRRFGDEFEPVHPMRGNKGRAFFGRAIDFAANLLTVPVNEFRRVGIVVHSDSGALAFLDAQQGSRILPVV